MDWKDSTTLVLPMVYVINSNITQMVREPAQPPIAIAANDQLKRFSEYPNHSGECSLFPAVRDLLMNFTGPNETPAASQGKAFRICYFIHEKHY